MLEDLLAIPVLPIFESFLLLNLKEFMGIQSLAFSTLERQALLGHMAIAALGLDVHCRSRSMKAWE